MEFSPRGCCLRRLTGATVSWGDSCRNLRGDKGLGREQLAITVVCGGGGWRLDKAPTVLHSESGHSGISGFLLKPQLAIQAWRRRRSGFLPICAYQREHGVLYPYTGAASLRYKPPLPLASHDPHPKTGATQFSTPLPDPSASLCLYSG